MDPNATLAALILAVKAGEFDAAQEALDTLQEWSARGGFLPSDPPPADDPWVMACQAHAEAEALGHPFVAADAPF